MLPARSETTVWRIGALALFVGVPLLLAGAAVANLTEASQADDLAARKAATTAAIVAQIEKHRAHHAKPVDTAALYLASASSSLARAEIQALATRLVDASGGRVSEVQLVETPEQEADGAVAIEVAFDIDNKGLRDLLYAVESGLPLLTVSDLNVQQAASQADEEAAPNGQLRVQMTVQGHWRKGAGMRRRLTIGAAVLVAVSTVLVLGARAEEADSLNPVADLGRSALDTFVQRPLFDPARQLPPPPPPFTAAAPPPPPPPPEPPPVLQLLGVVHGRRDLAIVHKDGTEKTVVLRTGERIGSWTVVVRPPVGVSLRNGDRTVDFKIFANAAQQGQQIARPLAVGALIRPRVDY